MEPIVRMKGICKSFGGTHALRNVDFDVMPGEIHALVGENGAGKSTLMKILGGAYTHDAGDIYVDGKKVDISSPQEARRRGIYVVHQEFSLVPGMTVAENVFLGRVPLRKVVRTVDWARLHSETAAVFEKLGIRLDTHRKVNTLSVAEQQLVEIARALTAEVRILVMDEPTASLTNSEARRLFDIVAELKQAGVGIVFISHRLDEVFAVADRATVLRDGQVVGVKAMAELTPQALIGMMIGRDLKELFPKVETDIGDVVLSVAGLSDGRSFRDVSFTVRRGEILGIAGLVGAGRTEVARTIFGLNPRTEGKVFLFGKEFDPKTPGEAVAAGVGFVTEDRKGEGIVMTLTVSSNLILPSLPRFTRLGMLRWRGIRDLVNGLVKSLSIVTRNPYAQKVRELSGGNQQKVVIGKWLGSGARLLIFDEPTRGVDVGTKAEIHRLMGDFVAQGNAVVMISSELPEVLGVSDRILVMHEGTVAAILDRKDADQHVVGSYMVGERGSGRHGER